MREQGRASEGKQKDVEKAVGEVNDVDDGGQHYTVFKMESLINWDLGGGGCFIQRCMIGAG